MPRRKMTSIEAVFALDDLDAADPEAAHGDADAILLKIVPKDVAEAYQRVVDRAGWWAGA